ncbi:hypothetical protein [Cupriavidus oxalaticus]|uniref:Uncharacterized protein n=1 Tax=Cupriavidus oxalaticus TaxID=96344 RepID=A0A4V1BZ87_9BURK|nr:hypothetical protein [Cupriavidus oxalaticus]QBY54462.1 hypothetical protein E0W60_26065 [Cupriavidus oxalaticus]
MDDFADWMPVCRWQARLLRMTRRTFIGSMIATGLMRPGRARSATAEDCGPRDLEFLRRKGALLIRETPAGQSQSHEWLIATAAFGPGATYTVYAKPCLKDTAYLVAIDEGSFGDGKGTLHFTLSRATSGKWQIQLRTGFWGADTKSDVVLFRDFCDAPANSQVGKPLTLTPPTAAVSKTLDTLLHRTVGAKGRMRVSFHAACTWTIQPDLARDSLAALRTLATSLQLSTIEMGWCVANSTPLPAVCTDPPVPALLGEPIGAQTGGNATQNGTTRAQIKPVFLARGTSCSASGVVPFGKAGNKTLLLKVTPSIGLQYRFFHDAWSPSAAPTVATLSGEWALALKNGDDMAFGPVCGLQGSIDFTQPAKATNATQIRMAFTLPATTQPVTSAVGRMLIAGADLPTVGADNGAAAAPAGETSQDKPSAQTTDKTDNARDAGQQPGDKPEQPPPSETPNGKPASDADTPSSPAPSTSTTLSLILRHAGGQLNQARALESCKIEQIEGTVWLKQVFLAPTHTDDSKLVFTRTPLTLLHPYNTRQSMPPSYLWLAAEANATPMASVALDNATLTIGAAQQLIWLRYRFAGMWLNVHHPGHARGQESVVLSAERPYRSKREAAATPSDAQPGTDRAARPVIVVELPPQHMMERAYFLPQLPPLPDVVLKNPTFKWNNQDYGSQPEAFLAQLRKLSPDDVTSFRLAYGESKAAQEPGGMFDKVRKKLSTTPWAGLPDDQRAYVGPYGMDPDVWAKAREVQVELFQDGLKGMMDNVITQAENQAASLQLPPNQVAQDRSKPAGFLDLLAALRQYLGTPQTTPYAANTFEAAVGLERAIGSCLPAYQQFRDFYRDWKAGYYAPLSSKADARPPVSSPIDLEFFNKNNLNWRKDKRQDDDQINAIAAYVSKIGGAEEPELRTQARYAGPTRLAFHVDGTDAQPAGKASPSIPFTLAGLTALSDLEPAVVPRARAFGAISADADANDKTRDDKKAPDENNKGNKDKRDKTPSVSQDAGTPDPRLEMLRRLRFRSGRYVTLLERLADVYTSLQAPPGMWETSIEAVSRLQLSTSQNARYMVPTNLHTRVYGTTAAQGRAHQPRQSSALLWSLDLAVSDGDVGLRAIHSPDLRPGALLHAMERDLGQRVPDSKVPPYWTNLPGVSAPPRGPRAPWAIGTNEGTPGQPSPIDLFNKLLPNHQGDNDPRKLDANKPCPTEADKLDAHPARNLLRYLCERPGAFKDPELYFRTAMDAFDRHELVLLSSAWGLPVRGRRDAAGRLQQLRTSSQVEPGDEFRLIDAESGTAIYQPRPLNVSELRLTALGATFRHDTTFVPPAGARHLALGPSFDALSIERWQHWSALGRDLFVEVVYKGFLFPLGHRASLVKRTERTFLKGPAGTIRAYLRQRMFIRVGAPRKAFPAIGQPNGGRQMPVDDITILTLTTPDIIDPTLDVANGDAVAPSGRVLSDHVGLMFWPRVAQTDGAEVRFEFTVDGLPSRMPLMFVDNVAAHNDRTMRALITQYNGIRSQTDKTPADLRTLPLGGQKHRYAPEHKPGDTSHQTHTWQLKAQGGPSSLPGASASDKGGWEGENLGFDDPLLEAAEQPPFYPAIEVAWLRIDQVDQFAGQPTPPIRAQFDGHYVAYGFPVGDADAARAVNDNGLEIYLNVLDSISLSMGGGGAYRSGGIFSPNSPIAALSRKNGPLSGKMLEHPVPGQLGNLVGAYGSRVPPATKSASPAVVTGPNASMPQAVKQFFNGDGTKLFGLVPIFKLLEAVNNWPSDQDALPKLKEFVSYGQSEATRIASDLLTPLREKLDALLAQWESLDKTLRSDTSDATKMGPADSGVIKLGLADAYPDVDSALRSLVLAVHSAADGASSARQGNGNVAWMALIGAVYESGRRLVTAIDRVGTHPLQGLAAQAGASLHSLVDGMLSAVDSNVKAWVISLSNDNAFRSVLINQCLPPGDDVIFSLPLPVLTLKWINAKFAAIEQAARPVAADLQPPLAALLAMTQDDLDAGKWTPSVVQWINALLDKTASISVGIDAVSGVLNSEKAQAKLELKRFEERLEALRKAIGEAASNVANMQPDFDYQVLQPYVQRVLGIAHALRQMFQAASEPNVPARIRRMYAAASPLYEWIAPTLPTSQSGDQTASLIKAGDVRDQIEKWVKAIRKDDATAVYGKLTTTFPKDQKAQAPGETPNDVVQDVTVDRTFAASLSAHFGDSASIDAIVLIPPMLRDLVTRYAHKLPGQVQTDLNVIADDITAVVARISFAYQRLLAATDQALGDLDKMTRVGTRVVDVLVNHTMLLRAAVESLQRLPQWLPPASIPDADADLRDALAKARQAVADACPAYVTAVLNSCERWYTIYTNQPGAFIKEWLPGRGVEAYDSTLAMVATRLEQAALAANAIRQQVATCREESDLEKLADTCAPQLIKAFERGGYVSQLQALQAEFVQVLTQTTAWVKSKAEIAFLDIVSQIQLATLYDTLLQNRNKIYDDLAQLNAQVLQEALLVTSGNDPLTPKNDQLAIDREALDAKAGRSGQSIVDDAKYDAIHKFYVDFLAGWARGSASPLVVATQVSRALVGEIRAKVEQLLDLAAVRDEVDTYIRKLLPTRRTLQYDYSVDLPTDASRATAGILVPRDGCNLTIHAEAVVDLLDNGPPSFTSKGEIGPFNLVLVGTAFPAVEIQFAGATFSSSIKSGSSMTVRYTDFRILEKLKFLDQLQSLFTPKQGSGFYLAPLAGRPGIESGYSLNVGTFNVGNLAVFNVSLNASVVIPFDGSESRFRASLSRKDAPFTIAVAPYGGSGFFAVEANATGVVATEASFEYGGAGAFSFGPLTGSGRLMFGIYVRQEKLTDDKQAMQLAGTFFAGGSANISVFTFGASLYVQLLQKDDAMHGIALFTFSFSVGFYDIEFHVHVEKSVNWKSDSNSQASATPPGGASHTAMARDDIGSTANPQSFADGDVYLGAAALREGMLKVGWSQAASTAPKTPPVAAPRGACDQCKGQNAQLCECCIESAGAPALNGRIVNSTICQGQSWSDHLRYYDMTLQPHMIFEP